MTLRGYLEQESGCVIIEHDEKAASDFTGTIIDIETVGDFNRLYQDSRRYSQITQVILGYINRERLHIYCARDAAGIEELRSKTPGILEALPRPFHAFNCAFRGASGFIMSALKFLSTGNCRRGRLKPRRTPSARWGFQTMTTLSTTSASSV